MTAATRLRSRHSEPIPARAGIGLRAVHQQQLLATRPPVGWVEVHSENYFSSGDAQLQCLERTRGIYPLSLHGVGLSLGSTDPLDRGHLRQLKELIARTEPMLVSEHLSWSSVGRVHFNDLLPLAYTAEALAHLIARVTQVQEFLGRQILIENVSSYLEFRCSEMPEWEFLGELARRAGCGILLDVNNVYVSSRNHGFDPIEYLDAIPAERVGEIHLAGHTVAQIDGREILIDTHSAPVADPVWDLYRAASARLRLVPTLIEWDAELPALEVLVAQAQTADRCRKVRDAVVA